MPDSDQRTQSGHQENFPVAQLKLTVYDLQHVETDGHQLGLVLTLQPSEGEVNGQL